jgi:hypothetical protein
MGMSLFSSSSYDNVITQPRFYDPNPLNYVILNSLEIGSFLLLKIKYPDCKNYEGVKILLYDGCTLDNLLAQKSIDPHFSDSKCFKSPIARFEPTDSGWCNAKTLALLLTS